ncbi:hypothetical protein [Bacillus sp. AFS017336]|uniref:hypothetical protein n=1 Tax=Bacillus sp. AFS017336 TaxID=2033489 RepID=UPI000BF245AD|nr:hypothetical protein [Bacillus sp. AFS017336]PEL13213.1 hypothetical protein CN601_04985 [Bacillus sp. AFS017336]
MNKSVNYDFDIQIKLTHKHYTEILPEERRLGLSQLAQTIENKIKPFIPEIYHTQFQRGNMVMHDQLKTFAYKLNVAGQVFHFVATDRMGVGNMGFIDHFIFTIELVDKETYEKHLLIMNKQIDQIKRVEERERKKKLEIQLQQEERIKEMQELQLQEQYRIYYDSEGNIDYLKTPIRALEAKGLL